MKKLLISVLLLGSMTTQAETVGDTLLIKKPSKVTIETSDKQQHITINGSSFNSDFKYEQTIELKDTVEVKRRFSNWKDLKKLKLNKKNSKDKKNKRGVVESDVYLNIGMGVMTGAPSDYKFRVWPSWEIGVGITADWYPFGNRNCWSIGFGLEWRRYRMSSDYYLTKDFTLSEAGYMRPEAFNHATQDHLHSSLNVYSLQIPVFYTHNFDRDGKWSIMLGGFVNFNTSAYAKMKYTTGDNDVDVQSYGIGQRPVTVDFMVAFDCPYFLNVYCKYSPTTFFKSDRGPKMHQLNFGFWF